MLNLDVAVASFWQLARHWKQGEKAKLELSCGDGSLHMQLSAVLGHPDQPHFPHSSPPQPPSPPFSAPKKKKSPSQLRRQERRRQEALTKAKEAASVTVMEETEENVSDEVAADETFEADIASEASEEVAGAETEELVEEADTTVLDEALAATHVRTCTRCGKPTKGHIGPCGV